MNLPRDFFDFRHIHFDWNRSISSYSKLQIIYSWLIRGRKFQIKHNNQLEKSYLNVGCGANVLSHFLNVDYDWRPGVDLCWDMRRPLPLPDKFLLGIYSEHCFEHISFTDCVSVLKECYRMLDCGKILRLVVPDAEMYLRLYVQAVEGNQAVTFPYPEEGFTPMMYINSVFRNHGHLFAYDFETLKMLLHSAGFSAIKRQSFRKGDDPILLIDSPSRSCESLYVEARK